MTYQAGRRHLPTDMAVSLSIPKQTGWRTLLSIGLHKFFPLPKPHHVPYFYEGDGTIDESEIMSNFYAQALGR